MTRILTKLVLLGLVIFQSCFSNESKYVAIRVRGSDSEVNLVQVLAERFMDRDSLTSVGVTGGGSGAGIAALINHKTDLANSSREITGEELFFAEQRGVTPYSIVFAHDALAIVVNAENPVDSLTVEQLAALYSGTFNLWKEVGGLDEPVTLYGRQSSSGTFLYFREHVVRAEYSNTMIGMSGTAQIVDAIRSDRQGIGYVSAGYLDSKVMRRLKAVAIKKDIQHSAHSPLDTAAILSGQYPITRPLLQYSDGKPEGKLKEFVSYQFSPEGKDIIRSSGFYPVAASEWESESETKNHAEHTR